MAAASDREGTVYEAAALPGARVASRGEAALLVVPRPPADLSSLTLSVTQFVVPTGPPPPAPELPFEAVEGPWEFVVGVKP